MQIRVTEQPQTARDPARELLDPGRRLEFDRQVRLLRRGDHRSKRLAAKALVEFGQPAVAPLCNALGDRDIHVRIAVVRSLSELGDRAAVRPLILALKETLPGESSRRLPLLCSAPAVAGLFVLCVGLPLQLAGQTRAASYAILVFMALMPLVRFGASMLHYAGFHLAVVEALAEFAARDPAPELREVLPEVKAMAKGFSDDPTARRALAPAAERIDRLTAELRSLPIAAAPPAQDGEQLPRVSAEPAGEPGVLPRTVER